MGQGGSNDNTGMEGSTPPGSDKKMGHSQKFLCVMSG